MSRFDNIPDEDIRTVERISNVATYCADKLPSSAPSAWQAVAYEAILEACLRDWVDAGTEFLESDDADNLASIVAAAAETALQQRADLRDIAFRTILRGWLSDWVQNWRGEE